MDGGDRERGLGLGFRRAPLLFFFFFPLFRCFLFSYFFASVSDPRRENTGFAFLFFFLFLIFPRDALLGFVRTLVGARARVEVERNKIKKKREKERGIERERALFPSFIGIKGHQRRI